MNVRVSEFDAPTARPAKADSVTRFRERLQERVGIRLSPGKENMIRHRLAKRVAETSANSIEDYLHRALSDPDWALELSAAIEAMTTNTTYFFREDAHFDFLSTIVVPEALAANPGQPVRLNVWSAASSNGAEAYTAAMVLAQAAAATPRLDFAVIGTDISERMVHTARMGIYAEDQARKIPPALRRKYLLEGRSPDTKGMLRFVPGIRKHVRFGIMNLKDKTYPISSTVDVAFLRNVLIYFGPEDQEQIVDKVISRLKPGGYLFMGHSESMVVDTPLVQQIEPSVFRKI